MSHFAEVDENGVVLRVIVIEQEMLDTGHWGDPARWVQTSYNTNEGVHELGGEPLRKNYAGIGYTYDKGRDAFIPPKPEVFDSWTLDEQKCVYVAPVAKPVDANTKLYAWNEKQQAWTDDLAVAQADNAELAVAVTKAKP